MIVAQRGPFQAIAPQGADLPVVQGQLVGLAEERHQGGAGG
jgi:hypothetical protein